MRFNHGEMCPIEADSMANRVDPNQTAPLSDLGLHCLPRSACSKTYGNL